MKALKPGYLYIYIVACLASTIPVDVSATNVPVIDQENLGLGGASIALITSQSLAQTVTTGRGGILTSVGLRLRKRTGSQIVDPILRVLPAADDGTPFTDFNDALFTTNVPIDTIPTSDSNSEILPYVMIDVSSTRLAVNPKDRFAISLSRNANQPWVLWRTSFGTYSGGEFYVQDSPNDSWRLTGISPHYDGGF